MGDRVGMANLSGEASSVQTVRASTAWRRDIDLEIWVDAERDPVRIRLAGTLNGKTSKNLYSVVEELLSGGVRDFEFQAALHGSETDATDILAELRGISKCRDVRFSWSGTRPIGVASQFALSRAVPSNGPA
jgi:hypothetical protein